MTISNHGQAQSNGIKKNGEKGKDPEARNGEPAKAKLPETAKTAGNTPRERRPEKAAAKASPKKQSQPTPTPAQLPRSVRVLGFRGHCETEDHYPTSSLLLPNLDDMKKWVGMQASGLLHADCLWKAEQLFVAEDGHIYSRVGEMDEDHPGTALIEWSENLPFNLGPLPSGVLPELSQEIKAALAAASAASKAEKEAPASADAKPAETNGEPTKKPIGEGTPAPKPGERTARGKATRPKSAPPQKVPPLALRMKATSKHAKRT